MNIYIGLGSNVGDRGSNISKALTQLEQWGVQIVRASSLYESEPVGYKDQPWFYNMVLQAETEKSPEELLKIFASIEFALGRERKIPYGPRTIDLDLLLYNDLVLQNSEDSAKVSSAALSENFDPHVCSIRCGSKFSCRLAPDTFVEPSSYIQIPHPHLHERRFVLIPFAEIAPDTVHPLFKKKIAVLLKEVKDESIVRLLFE